MNKYLLKKVARLEIENLALRQQLSVLKTKNPRPRLNNFHRLFWVLLSRFWKDWRNALVIVKPETIVAWHRKGFKLFWKFKSRYKGGRPKISRELIALIKRMAKENGTWGAPRIHGELLKLGYKVAESTVSKYMPEIPPSEKTLQNWRTFLSNHKEVLAGMDFFTVPTKNFKILYGFFILNHHRREILSFGVTENPTKEWVIQQLRNAFPGVYITKYLVFDNDSIFSGDFKEIVREFELEPKQTSYRSPWQNGKAERWIRSLRNDVLNHIIPLNREHLFRVINEYVDYYHCDRIHDALKKDTPITRPIQKGFDNAKIVVIPKLGGLHHRYEWTRAA
jgi:putative transposase